MARVYFSEPFDWIANKRGDSVAYQADRTYSVTKACADAAIAAGKGRLIEDDEPPGDILEKDEADTSRQGRHGLGQFVRTRKAT